MIPKLVLLFIISLLTVFGSAQEIEEPDLYVFVGEKISVTEFEPETKEGQIIMDAAFRAKYKVLEEVYNDLKLDTLEFTAYDHYGYPGFSNFKHVLLYVVQTEEGFVHAKYLYSPLFLTNNGTWAGPYEMSDYSHPYNSETPIEPVRIDWKITPKFDYKDASIEDLEDSFPPPYYEIHNKVVSAIFGNYVNELFLLKKNGFLKARGYFN